MHRRLVENSLSLFLALFLLTLAAQSAAGRRAFDAEQLIHDASPSRWAHSVTSSEFGQAVKENRQSELIQLFTFLATVWLVWRG